MTLERLFQEARIWRASEPLRVASGWPSGYAALDAVLAGGGWPTNSLTEIVSHEGIDGLHLLLPLLAHLSAGPHWQAWVEPPHIPYAPALAQQGIDVSKVLLLRNLKRPGDSLWAAEQALRSGACSVVLMWLHNAEFKHLRRLQLAAEAGHAMGMVFRPRQAQHEFTPAALRLLVTRSAGQITIEVLKCKGVRPGIPVQLDPWPHHSQSNRFDDIACATHPPLTF